MTVPVQTPRNVSTAAPGGTVFPYNFKIAATSDLLVQVNGVTKTAEVDYTVSGVGSDAGGNITMLVPMIGGEVVMRKRNMAFQRLTDFQNLGDLRSSTLNNDQDEPVMMMQQLAESLDRSLQLPLASTASAQLPALVPLAPLVVSADRSGFEMGSTELTGDMLLRPNLANATNPNYGATLVGYCREDGSATTVKDNSREKLVVDRNYYVRPDGSNANNGLSNTAGGAFLTLQYAADWVRNKLDFNGFNVSINVADGTYTAGVSLSGPHTGKGDLYFIGNQATPSNVVISTNSIGGNCFACFDNASIIVRGFKLVAAGAGSHGLLAYTGSHINAGAINFGAVTGMHNECGTGSTIDLYAPYAISGGATGHWHTGSPSTINVDTLTATITGTPAFSAYFAGTAGGFIKCSGFTWTGSATGARYLSHKGGVIDGHPGLNPFLPGSTDGRVATGGIAKAGVTTAVDYSADSGVGDSIRLGALNTGTGAFTPFFSCASGAVPVGSFAINGQSSNTSDTSFGTTALIDCTTGTNDGTTIRQLAAGILFQGSSNLAHYGNIRRRGNDGNVLQFYRDTTLVGSISVTTTATAYNTSSDARLKLNVEPASYDPQWILDVAGEVKEFEFRAEPGRRVVGAIAQSLQRIAPEAVSAGDDGDVIAVQWGVDPAKLVWKLLLEVAQLRRRLDQSHQQ